MSQELPPGQPPIDPRPAFNPPPPPQGAGGPRDYAPPGFRPQPQMPYPPPGAPFGPAAYPPPPKRRLGRVLFEGLMVFLLLGSLLLNVVFIGGAAALTGDAGYVKQTTLVTGSSDKIAVVPIEGIIDDASAKHFDKLLAHVEKDDDVKAVVVEIDTPGGSATASDEMHHRLELFKQRMADAKRSMPVIVAMKGMATSGGYYVACAGDTLFAEPGTLTGNIGVLFPRFNLSEFLDQHGVHETTITDKQGTYKNAGSMFKPENDDERAYLQGLVEGTFTQFKAVVEKGRAGKLQDGAHDVFSGKAFTEPEALARGLIDVQGYPDDAYKFAAQKAGLNGPTVVRYDLPASLLSLVSARGNVGRAASVSIDGRGLTLDGAALDPATLQQLLTARPMYLWRGN